eukprot:16439826-Heterocapsa_arctica.AAC.1
MHDEPIKPSQDACDIVVSNNIVVQCAVIGCHGKGDNGNVTSIRGGKSAGWCETSYMTHIIV